MSSNVIGQSLIAFILWCDFLWCHGICPIIALSASFALMTCWICYFFSFVDMPFCPWFIPLSAYWGYISFLSTTIAHKFCLCNCEFWVYLIFVRLIVGLLIFVFESGCLFVILLFIPYFIPWMLIKLDIASANVFEYWFWPKEYLVWDWMKKIQIWFDQHALYIGMPCIFHMLLSFSLVCWWGIIFNHLEIEL